MVSGKTVSGFEFELDEKVMDNMELVDALADASENNPIAMSRAVKLLLGDEQRRKLYDHLRTEDGRVPVAAVGKEAVEIVQAFGKQGKN